MDSQNDGGRISDGHGASRFRTTKQMLSRKIALVHDWLVSLGGGERVLESMLDLYPSPIFTLIKDEKFLRATKFHQKEIFSSFIERAPFARKGFRYYLPFFPLAIERFDLKDYNLILS